MRVFPTKEQMDYLDSIGVAPREAPRSEMACPGRVEARSSPPRVTRDAGRSPAALLLIILAVMFLVALFAWSEEKTLLANSGAQNDKNCRLLDIPMDNECDDPLGDDQPTPCGAAGKREPYVNSQQEDGAVEDGCSGFASLCSGHEGGHAECGDNKMGICDWCPELLTTCEQAPSTCSPEYKIEGEQPVTPLVQQVDPGGVSTNGDIFRSLESEIASFDEDLATLEKESLQTTILLSVATLLSVGLFVGGRLIVDRHMRRIEMNAFSTLRQKVTSGSGPEVSPRCEDDTASGAPGSGKGIRVEPVQSGPARSTPIAQPQEAVDSAKKRIHLRFKPEQSTGPWVIGLASIKGNVRSENQDSCCCFQLDGHQVMIVADGCGGHPRGLEASSAAVASAAKYVLTAYNEDPQSGSRHPEALALGGIRAAARCLAFIGDNLHITDIRGGLRTTLIVVVARREAVGYAYIGDGGGCLVKSTGEIRRFLDPQKAPGEGLNVLKASLGPVTQGEPIAGVLRRDPGELVLVGTDGVFDLVEPTFPIDVHRGCLRYDGDLQQTAERVIEDLASFQDEAGYICDDNLTLGIVGDGTRPQSPDGVDASVQYSQAGTDDLPQTKSTAL